MPTGQEYRYRRHQWQQFRPTDPNILGLELIDDDPLTNGELVRDQTEMSATYQRYRGRSQRQQWPVFPRDVVPLESTIQPDIDLQSWQPPTAPYQRYRGRLPQSQWPVLSRNDPAGLQLVDDDPLTTGALVRDQNEMAAAYRRPPPRAPFQQYRPTDYTPFIGVLPDQDVNLFFVWARMWRPPSRAPGQQFRPTDPAGLGLELADQDITLQPVSRRVWYSPSRAPYQQYTPTDLLNLGLLDLGLPDLAPIVTRPQVRPPRAVWQQFRPTDYTPFIGVLPDQDVNLILVAGRMWRPPSRAAYQQPTYFDPAGIGLELADQDVTLRPVVQPLWRRTSRSQWQQYTPTDPNEFAGTLPDQDVNLQPVIRLWWRPAARGQQPQRFEPNLLGLLTLDVPDLYPIVTRPQVRPSRAPWLQYRPNDLGPLDVPLDVPLLHPIWIRTPYPPFRSRRQLALILDPSFLPTQIVVALPGLTGTWRQRHPTATWVLTRSGTWRLRRTETVESDSSETWRQRDNTGTWETE
jgi:hypothetical protein